LTFNGKTSGGLPVQSNKNLDFILTSAPQERLRIPVAIADTTGAAVPWAGFVIDQLIAEIPEG